MDSIVRIAAAAAFAITLVGCGGGGGGGAAGPLSPPPPPPPPPIVPGGSSSGGSANGSGGFSGDFRGPLAIVEIDAASQATVEVVAKTAAGAADDVSVDLTTSGGAPTLTLFFRGQSVDFNLAGAQDSVVANGLIDQQLVEVSSGGQDWDARVMDFNLAANPEYSRLLLFHQEATAGGSAQMTGAFSFGADDVDMPATGSATFDTGFVGVYSASATAPVFETFFGRNDVAVSFTNGTVRTTMADVDFITSAGAVAETSAGGVDFGLNMSATISGDDFSGTMLATGATMAGTVQGDFYGAPGHNPSEVAGGFGLAGTSGVAVGGFQGVCTCLAP